MAYTSEYPIFAVTADVVLLAGEGDDLRVLLIRRGRPPYQGALALPGGFVDIDEDLAEAARRELAEETGIQGVELTQLGAYGAPDRDPRGRTVGIAYVGWVPAPLPATAGDDAAEAGWFAVREVLDSATQESALAFDHEAILTDALMSPSGSSATGLRRDQTE